MDNAGYLWHITVSSKNDLWRREMTAIRFLLTGFILLLGVGCAATPNVMIWRKGNIEAMGGGRTGKVSYDCIRIGTMQNPYDGNPVIRIRLMNGTCLTSSDFSEDTIREAAWTQVTPDDRSFFRAADGTLTIFLGGVSFVYGEHGLETVCLANMRIPDKTYTSEIASEEGSFFRLPLNEEHVVEIFGQPDERHSYFSW